jgi:hypothetical protein
MEFVPAGEIIGIAHQVRTVGLKKSPHLPDGDYTFIDTYCIDASCDCQRTLIQVLFNGVHVSTIGFGWESPKFYKNWMGVKSDADYMPQMHGTTIDISSPNKVSPNSMLSFFNALLDSKWIAAFKSNYNAVKEQIAKNRTSDDRTRASSGPRGTCGH